MLYLQGKPFSNVGSDILSQYIITPQFPLQFTKKIAGGSFGSIYAIEYNGSCIAKRLLDILMGRGGHEEVSEEYKKKYHETFCRECVLLSQMNHDNIVRFIGVYYGEEKYDLTLILERLETDLDRYLQEPSRQMSLLVKNTILSDISCGLLYLHERLVVHRDLSAANILLTVNLRAKIADLGTSKIVDNSVSRLTQAPGTQAYMSPEALADGQMYNASLDIFSFGVIALYTAVQKFPEVSHAHVPDAVIARGEGEITKRKKWIDRMAEDQPELSVIVLWCLSDDPLNRPSAKCLNILMQKEVDNIMV